MVIDYAYKLSRGDMFAITTDSKAVTALLMDQWFELETATDHRDIVWCKRVLENIIQLQKALDEKPMTEEEVADELTNN